MGLLSRNVKPKAGDAAAFWLWFSTNSKALLRCDDPDSRLFRELADRLTTYHDGLVWQMDPADARPREFVVSADGVREHASAVEVLCDAVPATIAPPDWRVVRFRPRIPDDALAEARLRYEGVDFDVSQIEAAVTAEPGGLVSVELFLPQANSEGDESCVGPAFILLDMALGEYDVMCRMGELRLSPFSSAEAPGARRMPLVKLREAFERVAEATDSA
ncbi:MAG: hypothetical protein K2Q20_15460 [Phycisphaerales bacterium]|nr:hypothetical protein [Phycisphaerales bacterium]